MLLKEKRIQTILYEKAISQLKQKQNYLQNLILISGIVILTILIVLIILIYQRKKYIQKEIKNIIELKEEKRRTKAIVETQEREKDRIARELHDGIGQLLSAASMYFSKLSDDILIISPDKKTNYEHSITILNDACNELRKISNYMMPRSLTKSGLIPALEDMLSSVFSKINIHYNFETYGIQERLTNYQEIGLYRIAQELVTNIIKHANASTVSVQLFKNKNMIILIVEDNGKGINNENKGSGGIGLMNITSRTDILEGSFEIEKAPKKGTVATIRIPTN
ncbi:MAG: sensor histidine kinase, partial [Chlorobi bacterium]|nr:sensor histidine kinase [Chlorobiota bacterium]